MSTAATKHTAPPWKATADGLSVTVRSSDRELPIAEMWENGDNPSENAAFIVKCVNAHDDLLVALFAVCRETIRGPVYRIALEALAKAGAL